jgi:outer membrane protein TolC
MKQIAFALYAAILVPAISAQHPESKPEDLVSSIKKLGAPYIARRAAGPDFRDSTRMERLMRAGIIYLSLQDAIALVLENNLDIESARNLPLIADSDMLRASAGQMLRNTPTSISQLPPSASGPLANDTAIALAGSGPSGVLGGPVVQLSGSQLPSLDPVFYSEGAFGHQTDPLSNRVITGTNFLVSDIRQWEAGIQKGFLTGTSVDLSVKGLSLRQNAPNNSINPAQSAAVALKVRQHLLQGFGLAVNSRAIRIAKNNRHISDLVFSEQVVATVAEVVNLYFDLVAFNDALRVKRKALEADMQLAKDNQQRIEMGLMAPLDGLNTEAEIAEKQQEVSDAEAQILLQELILKNVLGKTVLQNTVLTEARIVPIDRFHAPEDDSSQSVAALIDLALKQPEVEQSAIEIENSNMSLQGIRGAARPTLDVVLNLQNNGLAGAINQAPLDANAGGRGVLQTADPFFVGNSGRAWSQVLDRDFPDYSIGFQLNIPLRNRGAQANMARDELDFRQQAIADQKLRNGIRLDVLKAELALRQARAGYLGAVKACKLLEASYEAERKMFDLGISNPMRLIGVQRDLEVRGLQEVTALNSYARAKNNLDAIVGNTLRAYDIKFDEAYRGDVKREPNLYSELPTHVR